MKEYKKYILVVSLCLACSLSCANKIMNLFIAVNYTTPEMITDYETLCDCRLFQSFFNDPNEMLAKVVAGATGYDVIEATSYAVSELAKMGKLQKLDKSKIVGLNNIDPKFLNPTYDPGNQYSVPYAYTPVFLAYNEDRLHQLGIIPDTWAVIFEPQYLKKLKGHITVFSSSRNVFAAALLYLGRDPNSTNIDDLNAAHKLINKASAYWTKFDTDSYYRGLLRGDIWVAMSYSTDIYKTILDAKSIHSPIKIGVMLQKEGNMYEMDNLVIPLSAPNVKYAYDFINTILKPNNAYDLALRTGSSIPNKIAYLRLSPELKNLKWIYPTDISKNHTFTSYDPKTRILVNEMWTEIQMQCKAE